MEPRCGTARLGEESQNRVFVVSGIKWFEFYRSAILLFKTQIRIQTGGFVGGTATLLILTGP